MSAWARRESGGSISSLFSRNSKWTAENHSKWEENSSSDYYQRTRLDCNNWKSYTQSPSISSSRYSRYSTPSSSIDLTGENGQHRLVSKLKNSSRSNNYYSQRSRGSQLQYSSMMNNCNYKYVMTNEKIDYKTLFERERQQKEVRLFTVYMQ